MFKKVIFSFAIIFGSAVAFAAPLKLALNWKAEPQFGGFYAAKFLNHFSEQKLDVDVLEGGSGTPTIQMLAAGTVDYAVVSADEIVLAHDRGAKDVVALFAAYQTNPQAIMTHAESGFKSLEDVLKSDGQLQWQGGLPYAQFFQKKFSPIKVRTVPYAGGVAAFLKDPKMSQQCFATSEPIAAEKLGAKVKVFLVAESGYNPYTTVLVTKASRLKNNPEEVKKVFKAVKVAWEAYLKDPTKTNLEMAKINKGMDADTFVKSAQAQKDLIETADTKKSGLGSMTLERWSALVSQMKSLGLIKSDIKPQDLFHNL